MTASKDGLFYKGETWIFRGSVRDAKNVPIDLTGGVVRLRIGRNGVLIVQYSTGTHGVILSPATKGMYEFRITPAQQTAAGLTEDTYQYAIWADLADGTSSVQNEGTLRLKETF